VIEGGTLTSVPGVAVGHHTDAVARTGVTVMTFPEPNIAAVEVRGGAPGSRETALLAAGMRVETIQALVFSGGSAFGLASADGVVQRLAAEGRGHPTIAGPVPIVPAAILYDLMVGDGSVRPGPAEGAAAYDARTTTPVPSGPVGAGTGASVAGWRGLEHLQRSGLGTAATTVGPAPGDATPARPVGEEDRHAVVAALVVVNAVGDAFTLEGEALTGGPHVPGPPAVTPPSGVEQTTLVALATDAALSRTQLLRLVVRAHDALAVCLRPAHTRFDGDIVFAVSCGDRNGDPDGLVEAAFETTGRAIETAVRLGAAAGSGDHPRAEGER
jgi:L-aminopeptidase/D-esterase-like protein